jgi:hypothetical protein
MVRGVHAIKLILTALAVIFMHMHIVSASSFCCAVRRGVLGFCDRKVAYVPIFNVERITCRSTTGIYIVVFPETRKRLDEAPLIPSAFHDRQQKQGGVAPRT